MKKINETKIKEIFSWNTLNMHLYFRELIKSIKYAFFSLIFFSVLQSLHLFEMIFRNFCFKSKKIVSSSLSQFSNHISYIVIQHKFNIV